MTDGGRWDTVRRLLDQLPGTSERFFDSGASRFYVGGKCFAYQSADLTSLVVAVDRQEWEALHLAVEPFRTPLPPATPRQRARYVEVALDDMDAPEVHALVRAAWFVCAPDTLRSGLADDTGSGS